jgi:regulator of protease activity HflC (stomatin/prohibitin superfamily)
VLDRLIDLLLSFLHLFRFWEVVDEYERAIVLRLGRFNRELGPGWHLICPGGVERALRDNVVPTTAALPPQSLTTKDGQSVVVSAIVTWEIADVRKLLLEVEGAEEVVLDSVAGELARAVAARSWERVTDSRFARDVRDRVRALAEPYGIQVIKVQMREVVACQSLRLIQGGDE